MKTLFDFTPEEVVNGLKITKTIPEMLELVSEYGDRTAIVDGEEYTFCRMEKRIGAIRNALHKAGVKQGDAVGVLFENSYEWVVCALATMSYGAIAVLLPYHLDDKTIFGCSMKYSFSAILTGEVSSEKVEFTKNGNQKTAIILTERICDGYFEAADVQPEDGAAVVFTAGTTGQSKGALLSHRALSAGMRNGIYGYENVLNQRYFLVLPLTHIFGLVRNLLTSLYTGSSLYICRNLKNMFHEIPAYKPTLMVVVPALAEMMLNMTKMISPDILGGELRTIICGAAVVAPYLSAEYDKMGIVMLAGYGLTESANLVSGNPETLSIPESVGLFYPNQEYKIVDGELWFKGDNLFSGYYMDPEATAAAMEDGFFKTGDLVKQDEEGRLYIVGRCKELIVLSTGENISPAELEAKFCEEESIQDALVYVEKNGAVESLVLEVLPRTVVLKQKGIEDAEAYCTEKIKEINSTLYDYQRINKIIIRTTDFERTPSMKIKRPGMM